MTPHDRIVTILAIGALLILILFTDIRLLFVDSTAASPLSNELLQFWKEIIIFILGIVAGYVNNTPAPPKEPPADDGGNEP